METNCGGSKMIAGAATPDAEPEGGGGSSQLRHPPMAAVTVDDIPPPPAMEEINFLLIKGSTSSSSSSHPPLTPTTEHREGTNSANKPKRGRPKVKDNVAKQGDPLDNLSKVLKRLLKECNLHLRSICGLNSEQRRLPYNSIIEHITALLLQHMHKESTFHVKKIGLADDLAFDPNSLPTKNPTDDHVEWAIREEKRQRDYVFQLSREYQPRKPLYVQPISRVQPDEQSLKNKMEFTPDLKIACMTNNVLNGIPMPAPYVKLNGIFQKQKEFISELNCASAIKKAVNTTPVSFVKSYERVVRLQNEKDFISELCGASTTKKAINTTPVPSLKSYEQIVRLQNEKKFIAELKGVSIANIVRNATPISNVKANEKFVRSMQNEKEFSAELKGVSTANIVHNATPISNVKANEQFVRSAQNETECAIELKGAHAANKVLDPIPPISYVKANEQIVRLVQNEKEFITELKGASTTNTMRIATPVSYVKPNEQIVRPLQNEKEFINELKGVSTSNIMRNATPISYGKANEQFVQFAPNEKECATELKGASTANKVLDPIPISYMKSNEQIVRLVQNEKEFITELKGASTTNTMRIATPVSYVKANEQIVRPVQNEKEFINGLKGVSTSNIVRNATPISYGKANEQFVQLVQNENECAIELKGAPTTNKVLDPIPISYVKANEQIVRLVQNEKEFITELKGASTTNTMRTATPVSYVKANEQIVRLVQNGKEFVSELKRGYTSNRVPNATTPVSYVKPNKQSVLSPVQNEREPGTWSETTFSKLKREHTSNKVLNATTSASYVKPNEQSVLPPVQNEREPGTWSETCKTSTVLDAEPISSMNPNEEILHPVMGNELVVYTPNEESAENKATRFPTERVGWILVDFRLPYNFDSSGMDLNKLVMPQSSGIQGAREFSFAERLSNWFVEVRSRQKTSAKRYDIYYYHGSPQSQMFRSSTEVMRFIMYEVYPDRSSKSNGLNLESGNSSQKREGPTTIRGKSKRRRRNSWFVYENEALWAKLVDEALLFCYKWITSSTGDNQGADQAASKLIHGNNLGLKNANKIGESDPMRIDQMPLHEQGAKKDEKARGKLLVVHEAMSSPPCNPCHNVVVGASKENAIKIEDSDDDNVLEHQHEQAELVKDDMINDPMHIDETATYMKGNT